MSMSDKTIFQSGSSSCVQNGCFSNAFDTEQNLLSSNCARVTLAVRLPSNVHTYIYIFIFIYTYTYIYIYIQCPKLCFALMLLYRLFVFYMASLNSDMQRVWNFFDAYAYADELNQKAFALRYSYPKNIEQVDVLCENCMNLPTVLLGLAAKTRHLNQNIVLERRLACQAIQLARLKRSYINALALCGYFQALLFSE